MERFQFMNSEFMNFNELLYRINRAGSGEVDADFCIERNSSYPYGAIHYIVKGSGEVVYRGKKHCVRKGQCFVLNSFEGHCYSTHPKDIFELNWVEFNGGDSAKLLGAFLNSNLPIIDEAKSKSINKLLLRIFVHLKNNTKNRDIVISKTIYSILMQLLAEFKKISCSDLPESKAQEVQRVMNYIDSNLNENLSMGQLSKVINYNSQYFTKLFYRHTGVTPAKYIMDRRINRAKEVLSSGDIQVDLLAEQLGYCNASHFIRKFKKAEGLTPAEFRKESIAYYRRN